jgi:hypothetical protein
MGIRRLEMEGSRTLLVISGSGSRFTRTALDVGGPCVEAFGMISENSSPERQGRLVT